MKTPDQQVSDKIVEQFSSQELLSPESIEKIKGKLATGLLTSQDWRLVFETDSVLGKPK